MIGEVEMEALYGACQFCGEQQIVNAADQADANIKVTNKCTCPDALFHKKKMQIIETMQDICSGEYADAGKFILYDSDQLQAAMKIAELVQLRKFASAQVTTSDSVLKISINNEGTIKINRVRKEEIEAEI